MMTDYRSVFRKVIPANAILLIEWNEYGNGPNKGDTDDYFFLGYTNKKGIGVYINPQLRRDLEPTVSACEFSLAEVEELTERIEKLSFEVSHDRLGFDGGTRQLFVQFPFSHSVTLRWRTSRHKSWNSIFQLIHQITKMIDSSPSNQTWDLSEFKAKVHKHSTYDQHINFSYPLIEFSREQHRLSAKKDV